MTKNIKFLSTHCRYIAFYFLLHRNSIFNFSTWRDILSEFGRLNYIEICLKVGVTAANELKVNLCVSFVGCKCRHVMFICFANYKYVYGNVDRGVLIIFLFEKKYIQPILRVYTKIFQNICVHIVDPLLSCQVQSYASETDQVSDNSLTR